MRASGLDGLAALSLMKQAAGLGVKTPCRIQPYCSSGCNLEKQALCTLRAVHKEQSPTSRLTDGA
jgi:hypothetical protein